MTDRWNARVGRVNAIGLEGLIQVISLVFYLCIR